MKNVYYILISCYFCIGSYMADETEYKMQETLGLAYYGEGYLFSYPPVCTELLDQFADNASNLTKCTIKYARPVRLCEKCITEYVDFQNKYQELINTVVNGTSCHSIFISHDRLEVVLESYNGIMNIWKKGNCDACYDWSNGKPVLSKNTTDFYNKYHDTMNCITSRINPGFNNSEKICEDCKISYLDLNKFYMSLSKDNIDLDSVCMDVVDSMNATRLIWSKTLNCCQLRRTPETIFLCCTAIISILPLMYYLILRFFGPMKDLPRVLKQSRFKQTILKSLNGRIN